jgi:uncharacterized membrane protein
MDGLLILIGLIAVAIPVAVIVLLIGQSNLRARVRHLEREVNELRSAPARSPAFVLAPEFAGWPVTQPAAAQTPPPEQKADLPPADDAAELAVPAAPATPAQDGPIVMTAGRASALATWMQSNWIYVVSAVSLALAGVFLVQYGVQNGLLPPWLRVAAAFALGGVLIAAAEWVRRRSGDDEGSDTAFLPSVFAGAGIVILFAATIAARQLYDLIGANTALALHVLSAALAVVLGWFYGPLLMAIGLIGAAAAPFLIASPAEPTPLMFGYYALIAATGLAADAVRRWAWVSVLALVLAYLGGAMMMAGGAGQGAWLGFVVILPVLAILLPAMRLTPDHAGPTVLQALLANGQSGWPPFPVRLAAGPVLVSSLALAFLPGENALIGLLAFAAMALLAAILLIWAEKAEGLADLALMPALALVARLVFEETQRWPLAADFVAQALAYRPPETAAPMTVTWIVIMATLITAAFTYRALRGGPLSLIHGLAAVLVAPVAVAVLELFWAPARVLGAAPWALHPMVLAAVMVALAARFARTDGDDHRRMAYATLSALSLIALSLFLLTSATALTLALAVLALVAAGLDRRFALPEMGLFIQIAVAVLSYRLLIDPGIDWAMAAPVTQVLLAFLGTVAAQAAALRLLQDRDRVMTRGVLESAALAMTAVLANILLTRWLVPDLYSGVGLDLNYAASLNAMPWMVLMLTQAYRAELGGPLRRLRQVFAVVAGVLAAAGLFISAVPLNPLFAYYPDDFGAKVIGPPLLDTLALSYALPGLMLLIAAWRLHYPRLMTLGLLSVGSALLALYTALEIRRFWQGDWLGAPGVTQPELYSYTIALLLLGAALIYQSIASRSATLRRIAMTVIALTIAKVFLIDAAGLTGLTRVFSFLGLGLSLAGLAWLNRWAAAR